MFFVMLRNLSSLLAPLARPPFKGLGAAVILYFAWSFLVYPGSPTLRGDLPDTDDYMYLNQVLDWMGGQGWYDNIQHRLDPPQGVPIHFSRLAQLPMAGLVGLFELCGLGPRGAATLMAMIYPLLLLGGFFAALRWLALSFVPRDWVGATAYVALFATGAMFMFKPGHIDHHGLTVVLTTLAFGGALRMIERPEQKRWGVYAGAMLALSQTVALEELPWLLLLAALIGLWSVVTGGNAARNGLAFALTLAAGSAAGLAVTRPPSEWMAVDVLTYSVVYVILAAGIAVPFIGIALAARGPAALRWAVGGGLAAVAGFLFLRQFPSLIDGPYGAIDPALAQIILGEMTEALPFKTAHNDWFAVARVLMSAFIAVGASLWFFIDADRREDQWRWGALALLALAALALTVFYQRRFVATLGMLSIIPLTVILHRGWLWIGEHWRGRPRAYAELFLILAVGPLPAVLYPALSDGRSFNTGVLLFPAVTRGEPCEMFKLEMVLRDKAYYGDRPRLIMNTIGAGPELLFRTPHKVLSAPFHMDVDGNVDATRFFSTPYPQEAEAIARRRHVDLVVACRAIPEVYMRKSLSKELAEGDDLKDFAPHLIQRLMTGTAPDWLKRVDIPGLDNYVIYEMLPPK